MRPRLTCHAPPRLLAAAKRSTVPPIHAPARCAAAAPSSPSTRQYATSASIAELLKLPDDYIPPTQPPSARRPEVRKTQLLRTYTSLLRSTPLLLMFQHNNLTAVEWAAIRRELRAALAAVEPPAAAPGASPLDISPYISVQIVRTRMFTQALKVVEFYDPATVKTTGNDNKPQYTHDLSVAAYEAVKAAEQSVPEDSMYAQLAPLLVGPLALVTFPAVSPQHLAAALSILAPSPPAFPAPSRRKNPGYYDLTAQTGLQKLMLVGARVEGKVFDNEGVKWVGGIEGGLDGLRAQLVAMLHSAGMGLTSALEGASKSLWVTMESRRIQLEDAGKEGDKKE